MTLQTLAGEWPFRMSFTDPPLMCSTAASIDDRKNLGKSQVKVHLHSQDIETSCQQTEQYCKDCHQRQCASWLMNSHSNHAFFFPASVWWNTCHLLMGPLQLSDHVEQNCQTGEQMKYWNMLDKATKFEFSLFQCVICSPVWRTTWSLSCKGPIAQ